MSAANSKARVVIIGGGIMGLSTAYHLARRGITDVTIVERGYLCGGASGRNGGGVRAQFSSETNIRLMQESIRICRDFAAEMKINVWFRQGGYLFLTRSDARAKGLEASVKLQRECGLETRLIEPKDIRTLVPELDASGVVLASFNPRDGVVFPWPFVWGYAKAVRDMGVRIETFADVIALETEGSRVRRVVLRRTRHDEITRWEGAGTTHAHGEPAPSISDVSKSAPGERMVIECDDVVCCAGAWSPEIAAMAGVALPNHPHRHEICSTEPLKPWLGPLVADLTDGLYFSQSARGEIVGGIGVDPVPPGINQRSSVQFLAKYSRALVRTIPAMARVRVLRQWAGCYDLTPDGSPLLGRLDQPENLSLACGFMGHGFMMAPVMGKLIAEHLAGDASAETRALFDRWALRRFAEGRSEKETMIIG